MLVRAPNPVWYFVNNLGIQLDDTYFAFFLQNIFPFLPQPVYQDNQGLHAWTQPVQFLMNGTLPNNLYFPPNLVYKIQIRQGNTMDAPLIYEIDNFIPGSASVIPPIEVTSAPENQITNPQFALTNFVSPLTITTAGTYSVAPGWNLVLTGSGSTTVSQVIISGSESTADFIPGNPPFALEINNSGWTTATLEQKFIDNGAIWANGAVSTTLLALATGGSYPITINYVDSAGNSTTIAEGEANTFGYTAIEGGTLLPGSTNTQPSNIAYVNFEVVLPTTGNVSITNVQVFGQEFPISFPFEEETVNRQIDHSFNVYANELIIKPKDSIITAWNFALNPFQFNPTALSAAGSQCQYVADQTILYQQVAGTIKTGKASVANGSGLLIAPNGTPSNSQFAIIQYVDASTIAPYWSFYLSSLVRAKILTSSGSLIPLKMRLIVNPSLPSSNSPTYPIASWTAGADPVFATGWTALSPLNDPAYVLSPSFSSFESGSATPAMSFNQFPMPVASSSSMTLGIVLYTTGNMAASDSIIFDKASLVPNRFAVDTNPETFDDTLRQCQYYYEKSYDSDVFPGSVTAGGILVSTQLTFEITATNIGLVGRNFGFKFSTVKREVPTITFYSPTGTSGNVQGVIINNGAQAAIGDIALANWSNGAINTKAASYFPNTATTLLNGTVGSTVNPETYMQFQYTLDSRLGI